MITCSACAETFEAGSALQCPNCGQSYPCPFTTRKFYVYAVGDDKHGIVSRSGCIDVIGPVTMKTIEKWQKALKELSKTNENLLISFYKELE